MTELLFSDMLKRFLVVAFLCAAQSTAAATILVYGDSLSAGYGVPQDQSWPSLLNERLRERRLNYTVANASISGETTLGGRNRIKTTLAASKPFILILALGANDGLRGQDPTAMRANLAAIIEASRQAGSRVLLVGMRLPPNYGPAYTEKFQAVYRDLAKRYRLPLVPFLLEGFADKSEYFQADGIHPTAAAQPLVLETVWRELEPMLALK